MYCAVQIEQDNYNDHETSESRFARLDTRLDLSQHFHYEVAKLQSLYLTVKTINDASLSVPFVFEIGIYSGRKFWSVKKSLSEIFALDHQLHVCLLDRTFSGLPFLSAALQQYFSASYQDFILDQTEHYFKQLSQIINSQSETINCSIALSFFELDNKGNHLSIGDIKSLNIPAIAAAQVIRRHLAETDNELNLDLGDLISVIAMPDSTGLEGQSWWRGKKGLKTGYFPPQCVQIIDDKRSADSAIEFRQISSGGSDSENYSPSDSPTQGYSAKPYKPVKPVLKHNGKIASCLQVLFRERPSRDRLRQSGIYKLHRVFGTDLAEYVSNSDQSVPIVVRWCCEMIEKAGSVDGIYRHSGSILNINQLRAIFEDGKLPNPEDSFARDPHAVASLLKTFFRELQSPLLTYGLFFHFIEAVATADQNNESTIADSKSVSNLASLLHSLPPPHHRTLKYLMYHLSKMAAKSDFTGMTAKNLSIVFAPNIMRAYLMAPKDSLLYVKKQARVVELLITNYARLFENVQAGSGQQQQQQSVAQQIPSPIHHVQSQNQLLDVELARRLYQSQRVMSQSMSGCGNEAYHSLSVSKDSEQSPWVSSLKTSASHDDLKCSNEKDEQQFPTSTASKCRASLKKFAALVRDQLPNNNINSFAEKPKPSIVHCNSKLMNPPPAGNIVEPTAHPVKKSGAWRSVNVSRSKSVSSPDDCFSGTASTNLNKSMEYMDEAANEESNVRAKWLPALNECKSPAWGSTKALCEASSFTALNQLVFFSENNTPPHHKETQSLSKATSKAVLVRGPLTSTASAIQTEIQTPVLLLARRFNRSNDELVSNSPNCKNVGVRLGRSSNESLSSESEAIEHATPVQVVNIDFSNSLLMVPKKTVVPSETSEMF